MTLLKAFTVHDVKADLYGTPFFLPTNGQALRAFTDLSNDPQSSVSRYPDDFRLMHIGGFNDATGVMIAEVPFCLGFASEFVRKASSLPELREVSNG